MDERSSPAPLVPVGPDFPNYLSVNADKELTGDHWGLASPDLWAELVHVAPRPCSSSGRGGVSGQPPEVGRAWGARRATRGRPTEEELRALCSLVSCP